MVSSHLGFLQGSISEPDGGLHQGRVRVEKLLHGRLTMHRTGCPGPNMPESKEPLYTTLRHFYVEAGVGFMRRQELNSYDPCESLSSGHSTMAWKAVKQLLVLVVIKVIQKCKIWKP